MLCSGIAGHLCGVFGEAIGIKNADQAGFIYGLLGMLGQLLMASYTHPRQTVSSVTVHVVCQVEMGLWYLVIHTDAAYGQTPACDVECWEDR